MSLRTRPFFASLPIVLIAAGVPLESDGCSVVMPDESQAISLQVAPGASSDLQVSHYKGSEASPGAGFCVAYLDVKLSSFPSSRVATRPADVAAAIRELAGQWQMSECIVFVSYENDTGDELSGAELCLKESFKYDKGAYWSSSPEGPCWEEVEA